MGKKKSAESSLGRSLIKDRFGGNKGRKFVADNTMVSRKTNKKTSKTNVVKSLFYTINFKNEEITVVIYG